MKAVPPTLADLKSSHEMGKNKGKDECLRRALSVFRTEEDAAHNAELFPYLGKLIARATLESTHGKVRPIGKPTHTSWWPREGIDRVALFKVSRLEEQKPEIQKAEERDGTTVVETSQEEAAS